MMARAMCEKLAQAKSPVTFILPAQGGNEWDRESGPLRDAEGLAAFCDEMRNQLPGNVRLLELDAHINDAAFVDAALSVFDDWVATGVILRA